MHKLSLSHNPRTLNKDQSHWLAIKLKSLVMSNVITATTTKSSKEVNCNLDEG